MIEIEKRLGLGSLEAADLKESLVDTFTFSEQVPRTILVKTGEGFVPDRDSLVDIKVKLIGDDSILSIKHGSWHGGTARQEYETRFDRADLSSVLGSLLVLSYSKFILLSTLRTVWRAEHCIITLDEYTNVDKALFEVEATESGSEKDVDRVFKDLEIAPMDSSATINFIEGINRSKDVQIDLLERVPDDTAAFIIQSHPC
ncbi:MAG TPA: hypothetical protein VFT87_03175 [Candidatus Saccharimonadales bacterium]|nr:hypothetical protein [Candidatus Saccharimonadales bacterium]